MNYIFLFFIMSLSFVGCSEKEPEDMAIPTSMALSSLPAANFIKASTQRPSTIPAALDTTTGCQVDWVNNKSAKKPMTITEKARVSFVGWAGDTVKGTCPREVFIALYGPSKVYFKASLGLKRIDVSMALKKPGLENSGWEAYADLSGVAAGTYYMQVIKIENRSVSACDTQRTIVIK